MALIRFHQVVFYFHLDGLMVKLQDPFIPTNLLIWLGHRHFIQGNPSSLIIIDRNLLFCKRLDERDMPLDRMESHISFSKNLAKILLISLNIYSIEFCLLVKFLTNGNMLLLLQYPKYNVLKLLNDLTPISITSLLCRKFGKLIVRKFIIPKLPRLFN